MSGYNPASGIFELNWAKASRYLARPDNPSMQLADWRDHCAEMFRDAGFDVLRKTPYGIELVADDADVYSVLSGKEATWGRASPSAKVVFQRWKAERIWFNVTDLGKELSPPVGGVKVNRLLEALGYQNKGDDVWRPTVLAAGLYELRDGSSAFGRSGEPVPVWHRDMIDLLQAHLAKQPAKLRARK